MKIIRILYQNTLQSSHKIQRVVYLHSKARILFYNSQCINNVKWQVVSYGTITSNGAAMAKNSKPPNESQNPEKYTLQTLKEELTSAI